jgi:hypothetical protein
VKRLFSKMYYRISSIGSPFRTSQISKYAAGDPPIIEAMISGLLGLATGVLLTGYSIYY